jgi:hypothetical protein
LGGRYRTASAIAAAFRITGKRDQNLILSIKAIPTARSYVRAQAFPPRHHPDGGPRHPASTPDSEPVTLGPDAAPEVINIKVTNGNTFPVTLGVDGGEDGTDVAPVTFDVKPPLGASLTSRSPL